MLVTLAAKENCFQKPLKTVQTVRISKFIWQRVQDCRASVVEDPTAILAESTATQRGTVRQFRFADPR